MTDKVDLVPIYKLVEIISYSNLALVSTFISNLQISRNYKLFKHLNIAQIVGIYKLVEIISYSNCDQFPDCDSYLQISRNYKLFKQIVWGTMWRKIYKLVEIISYSNEAQSKRHYLSTN